MELDPQDLKEIIDDFIKEAEELLEQLDQDLITLENEPINKDILNRIFRNFHTIKGTANFLKDIPIFDEMSKIAHASEDIMGEIREDRLSITSSIMDTILESIDAIKSLFKIAEEDLNKTQDYSKLIKKLRDILKKKDENIENIERKQENIEKNSEKQEKVKEKQENTEKIERNTEKKQENIEDYGLSEEDFKEIAQDFILEAKEYFETLDENLINLEKDPTNQEIINNIFRILHTIKGTANFLKKDENFKKIGELSHALEDFVGAIRDNKISISSEIIDIILNSIDILKNIFKDVEENKISNVNTTDLANNIRNLIKEKKDKEQIQVKQEIKTQEGICSTLSKEDKEELIQDFIEESKELVEKIDQSLIQLEKDPKNKKLLNNILCSIHTLKGTTSFLGFPKVSNLAHKSEDIIKKIIEDEIILSSRVIDILLLVVDYLKNFFKNLEKGEKQEKDVSDIIEKLTNISSLKKIEDTKNQEEEIIRLKEREKTKRFKTSKIQRNKILLEQTIRVETKRLDKLMNLVGELVLGRNRLVQILKKLIDKFGEDKIFQELISGVDFISFVTSDLQMAVLKTRMQPIAKIFNKFNRTVRDLAKELGKEVQLEIIGSETELDKTVIDELGDPLIHLLRNSVDHGIEFPDEREKLGKPRKGTITLSATHKGNHIIIQIQDDGRGLNLEKIKKKAIEKNIITQEEANLLTENEILELIFKPGFSTAEKVTNLSGRGVGMDVVKSSIEKLNGSIDITSEQGKGCIFTIKLPLTLAIIQTLHVKVENEIYAIPITSVIETIRIYSHQIKTISGNEVITFRKDIIPLIRLDNLFEIKRKENKIQDKLYIVIAGVAEKKIGLVVDKILGQEEVVVKSMGKLLENTPCISGACIRGDGKITLIIDIGGIFKLLPRSVNIFITKKSSRISSYKKKKENWILVVEDSRSERKRTRMTLEKQGFKVVEAIDGKDALSKLKDYKIDLVITDIKMPELDGYQLTEKIREDNRFKNLPVIAVSSKKEMIDRIKGMEAGINTYIPKPFKDEDLLNAIKNFL